MTMDIITIIMMTMLMVMMMMITSLWCIWFDDNYRGDCEVSQNN